MDALLAPLLNRSRRRRRIGSDIGRIDQQSRFSSTGASLRDFKVTDVQSFSTGKLIYVRSEIRSREIPYLFFLKKWYLNRKLWDVYLPGTGKTGTRTSILQLLPGAHMKHYLISWNCQGTRSPRIWFFRGTAHTILSLDSGENRSPTSFF